MKYTAITIGPIYKTMQKARSSKAIWSASYLFSYMMKFIYQKVENEIGKDNILLPSYQETNEKLKVGIFPDRILFEGGLKDFKQLKSDLINDLADKILEDVGGNIKDIKTYLENYLLINKVEKEIAEDKSAVKTLNSLLDTSELFQKTNSKTETDYLSEFFEMKNKGYNQFINDEFGEQPIKSIEDIVKDSSKNNYIAIVQADGDSFGRFITNLTKKEVQEVSKNLFNFSKKAVKTIKEYGGVPIFAGGDDLMFFAPVIMEKQTIINLTQQIDADFKTEVLDKILDKLNGQKAPTLSYGINISYYKYPLDQALNNAGSLLFDKAKQENKNAIALRVTKHSGQVFETILHKNNSFFVDIQKLFENIDLKSDFISGFMYKLSPLSEVIKGIALSGDLENRFDAFFENYFDEDIHKKSLEQGFLSSVKKLIIKIYQENEIKGLSDEKKKGEKKSPLDKANDKNLNKLYSVLRFHQFINTKTEL